MSTAKFGMMGLGVMGQNLILNIERNGFPVAIWARRPDAVDDFLNKDAKGKKIYGAKTVEEFMKMLERPRRIMMMVKAGEAVDWTVNLLKPYLEQGDIICIFPEGHCTETGEMQTFRPGIKRIVERTPVLVVPMALRGLWGSFFSRKDGSAMSKPFRRGVFSRIALAVGQTVPPQRVSPEDLQGKVLALRGDWK